MSPPPFSGGETPFWMANDQQQQHLDIMSMTPQFDLLKKPPNFPPFPSMNPRMNPPSNKGTSHIFYKTRICAKFKEGTCRNGEQCTFAHGDEDLRDPPPNWQDLIRDKEREESWGDDQRMIHRMKICKKYYNGEDCPYGDKCNFLHERPMKKLKVDVPGQRESSAFSIGTTAVDFEQTGFWKTRLCSKWEMGQCPFGERCHFAHGQTELRISPDEAELVPTPKKIAAFVPAFITPPVNPVAAAAPPITVDAEEKIKSKWKLTKKVNRIYADWLDDVSPPRSLPNKEEEI